MKKIVRNNQTFIVNEELYKKIKKHSYLFEEEQTGSLFPDMDNKEKNKESESHKLANEVRRAELLNDARVEARILELYRKQYIRILSLSGEIEQAIQKNEGLSDFFKNIDMKKFIKIVVKSKALFTEFKRQYFRLNFVDKKITPAWNVFCKVFMSFIRSKRFREGTLKKT